MDPKLAASLFNSVTKCLAKGVSSRFTLKVLPLPLDSAKVHPLPLDSATVPIPVRNLCLSKRLYFLVPLHERKYTSWKPVPKTVKKKKKKKKLKLSVKHYGYETLNESTAEGSCCTRKEKTI